jgi:hypothetical protein
MSTSMTNQTTSRIAPRWVSPLLWLLAASSVLSHLTSVLLHLPQALAGAMLAGSLMLFGLFHGASTYGWRGIVFFIFLCLGVSNAFENLSILTGFPFGSAAATQIDVLWLAANAFQIFRQPIHLIVRQRRSVRGTHFHNLSAPFIFRERRLSQHHPCRVTDQALARGNIRADPGRESLIARRQFNADDRPPPRGLVLLARRSTGFRRTPPRETARHDKYRGG